MHLLVHGLPSISKELVPKWSSQAPSTGAGAFPKDRTPAWSCGGQCPCCHSGPDPPVNLKEHKTQFFVEEPQTNSFTQCVKWDAVRECNQWFFWTWYERCQRCCTLWWIAISRSKYQQPQEAINDPSSSLYFTIATALRRYPMATLRGSFAKVVVVDQPLCQELREIRNFPTAFDCSTGFTQRFWKEQQVLTSGETGAQISFHLILWNGNASIVHCPSWIIPTFSQQHKGCTWLYVDVHTT